MSRGSPVNANLTRRLDLLACAFCAAFSLVLALLNIESTVLRTLLGGPLALLAPGYALVAILFPRNTGAAGAGLRTSTRLMFSIGMSLAHLVIGSVALNFTPPGIAYWSLTTFLGVLTLVYSVIASYRLGEVTASYAPPLPQRLNARGFAPLQSGLIALAIVVASGAVVYSIQETRRAENPVILQMWMLPTGGTLPNTVRVGVRNVSAGQAVYRIELARSGYTIQEWRNLPLSQGETWEITTTVPLDLPGEGPVVAALYDQRATGEPVRRVQYWLR
jgi:uncharacterized membrane protein